MKSIYLTSETFSLCHPYNNSSTKTNMEADLYLLPNGKIMFKKYPENDPQYFMNKIKTILYLDEIKEEINIPELVYMDYFIHLNKKPVGFGMEYIKGQTVSVMLNGKKVPLKIKIQILKQIGEILQKIAKFNEKYNLAFGDIHGENFIYDGKMTRAIDTDGIRVKDMLTTTSAFLALNPNLNHLYNKYPCNKYGINYPTTNSDILCFIMMIINFISDSELCVISLNDYLTYLDYLSDLGFDSNLLNAFASVYEPSKENINPLPFLDMITSIPKEASYLEFKKNRKH